MDSVKTGKFISELRKEKGLTQIALAEKLNISNRAVSKWENGDGFPDITLLSRLSEILGVTVDELLRGKKNPAEIIPEPSFVNEHIFTKKELGNAYKAYFKTLIPEGFFGAIIYAYTIIAFSVFNMNLDFGNILLLIIGVCLALLAFMKLFMSGIYGKIQYDDLKRMYGDDCATRYEFGDKIHCTRGTTCQDIEYCAITAVVETKELFVFKLGRGHYFFINKKHFVVGDIDEFRKFIKGNTVDDKKDKRRRKFHKAMMIFIIAIATALIPLNIIEFFNHSDKYDTKNITYNIQYFTDNRNEFERGLKVIEDDNKLQKEIDEYGKACYWAGDYVALNELSDIEVGNNYVDFLVYGSSEYYTGIVYYDKNASLPYPDDIGYESKLDDHSFLYISDDDLYLLGKTENDNSSADEWYIVKIIDDNWYYYEYHN